MPIPESFYYPTLSRAQQGIKTAWIAGLISSSLTLVVTLAAIGSAEVATRTGLNVLNFLDVVLSLGLTVGIVFKNRICAGLMLLYFLFSKGIQLSSGTITPIGLGVALLFIFCYWEGIRGTFSYHKLKAAGDADRKI